MRKTFPLVIIPEKETVYVEVMSSRKKRERRSDWANEGCRAHSAARTLDFQNGNAQDSSLRSVTDRRSGVYTRSSTALTASLARERGTDHSHRTLHRLLTPLLSLFNPTTGSGKTLKISATQADGLDG